MKFNYFACLKQKSPGGGIGRPACSRQARKDIKSIMKKFYTYVLYSEAAKQIYIGHSDSIERRLKQHNKGKVASTKPYLPYKLIYSGIYF